MKIDSKEISIDDSEMGCSVTFYEKIQDDSFDYTKKFTIDQVMESIGSYISLNRTYPEDDFESDYYYIELSDLDKSDELTNFTADLYRTRFLIELNNELNEINFEIKDYKFNELKNILKKIFNNRGQFTVHKN